MSSPPPRFRVIGLVVGGAVLALAAGFFFLTRGQSTSSAAPHTVIPVSKRTTQATPTKPKPTAKRGAAARKPAARVAKPAPKPAPKAAPKPPPPPVDGVPGSVAAALGHNRVVVVALYAPKIELDEMAMREAEAGAKAVGAGFVALNVLDESQSRPLTQALGVLEDPGVLVYRRPAEVVVRFSGFADQETIAQAARNAGL
jgi:hypothetical protein